MNELEVPIVNTLLLQDVLVQGFQNIFSTIHIYIVDDQEHS